MRFARLTPLFFLLWACNTHTANEPEKTLNDSLLEQVLAGHDIAMPKMMKMERLQKEAATELDSLKKAGAASHKDRIAQLESTTKSLEEADKAMHDWMDGFRYDSLKDNPEAREAYLKAQLESVNKMKDLVVSSLADADTVLAK